MCALNYLELIGSIVCEELSVVLFSFYKKSAEPWVNCCKDGIIVQSFGKEADTLIKNIFSVYEKEASLFKTTRVFKQKKEILGYNISFSLQKIFETQILKIKNMSIQNFKEILTPIQFTSSTQREVRTAIKIVKCYFKKIADSLVGECPMEKWSYGKEYNQLMQDLREIAIERLHKAKIQGVYDYGRKTSTGISFHFLHPRPFNKDLKFEHLGDGDLFNFDSKFLSKVELSQYFVLPKKVVNFLQNQHDNKDKTANENLIYTKNPLSIFQANNH
ncbi:hypothetical protein CPARA_1gp126 (nucleomorph) [Cryptomonas paramecium]|uniref:Sey1/RHD3-like three-helix bundle domain-containing protein n=1 Tax=Cryptomonas paramaecium TaxID=2898 RepID=F2HHI8_9CRYP|nr:hypothetical protein CPARA_1gp126 [Cryptomonas paramecium]AEA38784.1 hypothetical protein CPARA_1gp126 [Cryptomonas paramecium]